MITLLSAETKIGMNVGRQLTKPQETKFNLTHNKGSFEIGEIRISSAIFLVFTIIVALTFLRALFAYFSCDKTVAVTSPKVGEMLGLPPDPTNQVRLQMINEAQALNGIQIMNSEAVNEGELFTDQIMVHWLILMGVVVSLSSLILLCVLFVASTRDTELDRAIVDSLLKSFLWSIIGTPSVILLAVILHFISLGFAFFCFVLIYLVISIMTVYYGINTYILVIQKILLYFFATEEEKNQWKEEFIKENKLQPIGN